MAVSFADKASVQAGFKHANFADFLKRKPDVRSEHHRYPAAVGNNR